MAVYKSFPTLDLRGAMHIAAPAEMGIADGLIASSNALYEGILNAPAPGSATTDIAAHEHMASGTLIPVGPVFCLDFGEDNMQLNVSSVDNWATTWSTADPASATLPLRIPFLTPFYVPPSMVKGLPGNGSGDRVMLRMFLDCLVQGGSEEMEIRVVTTPEDGTSPDNSDITTVTSTTYTEMTTEIGGIAPHGGWNFFYIQLKSTSTLTFLRLRALTLVATDEDSMPDTSGIYLYSTLGTL